MDKAMNKSRSSVPKTCGGDGTAQESKLATKIEILSGKKLDLQGEKLYATTIGQLREKGCCISVSQFDENGGVTDLTIIGESKKIMNSTPVGRGGPREKRKYECEYDMEKEMQIQMGALFWLRRREYDPYGDKGLAVGYKDAAVMVLKFCREILPVVVNSPCCGESAGATTVKEEPIGYLRYTKKDSSGKDTAVEGLAKAIKRRIKKGRIYLF